MSEATRTAMEAAIAAHIADESESCILTGYVLAAAGQNADNFDRGSTNYFYELMPGQQFHSGVGLTHMLAEYMQSGGYDDED